MLESIRSFLPPNNLGNNQMPIDWEEVERTIQKKIPIDYKQFIDMYGFVMLNGDLIIYHPKSRTTESNLIKQATEARMYYNPSKEGDLLAWGASGVGSIFYWEYKNHQAIKIISMGLRGYRREEFDLTMTEFIYSLLTKKVVCDSLGSDFADNDVMEVRNYSLGDDVP